MRLKATAAAAAASLVALAATAQTPAAAPATPASATAAATPVVAVDLPAQPLDRALNALARQSGARIVFSTELTEQRRAPAVAGAMTVVEALDRLLAGSGLAVRATGGGGFTVFTAATPSTPAPDRGGAARLAPVTVTAQAERETATSAVAGYFAARTNAATKTDTPIVEVPQSVSVVTRRQLDDQRPASLTEALAYAPGVFTGQVGATNRYDYVPLRGFIETSTDNTVLDGLKVLSDGGSYSSMQVEPFFVERIDVYRGPSSVLFGRNAPGGLVAMTSKRPAAEPGGQVVASVGSDRHRQAGLDLTGPVDGADGAWTYRLLAMARDADTMTDHVQESRVAAAPSLQWQPDGRTRLLLQAYLQNDPDGGYHGGVPADVSVTTTKNGRRVARNVFDGDPSYNAFKRRQSLFGWQFEHTFDNQWTVRQHVRTLRSKVHLEQVYQAGWDTADSDPHPDLLARYVSGGDEVLRGWTADHQAQRDFRTGDVRHTLLAGLDHQHRHVTGSWTAGAATDLDPFAPVYGAALTGPLSSARVDRRLVQTGLYVQDQLALGRWRFTVAGRQDRARTESLEYGTENLQTWSGSKFSGRAGAVYLLDNGFAPYASYSESFNPSGFIGSSGQVLDPTQSRQVEVGVKYEPPGGVGLASIAAYDLVQDNVATRVLGQQYYEPVGEVRSRGLEAEARLQLRRDLALIGSYTFTDAEYTRGTADTQGRSPYQAPRHMAAAWADWTVLAGVALGGGVRHTGWSWADNANTLKVPAYTLVDLALRVDLGRFDASWDGARAQLNVKNVADKTYVASCASTTYCYFGDARRVTATVDYSW